MHYLRHEKAMQEAVYTACLAAARKLWPALKQLSWFGRGRRRPEPVEVAAKVEDAPDLLAALENIVALYDTDEGCKALPEYVAARAAIAKAKGIAP